MRRRLAGLLVLAATLTAFVLPASGAIAAPEAPAIVLAAETGGEGGEAPGPEPMGADETDNPAAPDDYEANFLWGAGVGLLGIMLIGAAALAGLYFLLVVRPQRQNA